MKYGKDVITGKFVHILQADKTREYVCGNCGISLIVAQGDIRQEFRHHHDYENDVYFNNCEKLSEGMFDAQQREVTLQLKNPIYKFYIGFLNKKNIVFDGEVFYGTDEDYKKQKFTCKSEIIEKIELK